MLYLVTIILFRRIKFFNSTISLSLKNANLITFVLIIRYEALTASGKRVEIHLGDRKQIPADKTIHNIT